jgi:TetR/AcrR family transcriptional repressor of nem operon
VPPVVVALKNVCKPLDSDISEVYNIRVRTDPSYLKTGGKHDKMSSREKVLQVSLDLFYRKGYQATSVDDIIEAAGVSKSNFYYHFKSKEDLGLTVLQLRSDEMGGVLGRTLCNQEIPSIERLSTFLEYLSKAQEDSLSNGGCPFGNLVAEMADHNERFRCELSDMFGGMTARIAEVIREGQESGNIRPDMPTEELAHLVVQTLQGMLLLTKCHKSIESFRKGARVLVRLIAV